MITYDLRIPLVHLTHSLPHFFRIFHYPAIRPDNGHYPAGAGYPANFTIRPDYPAGAGYPVHP